MNAAVLGAYRNEDPLTVEVGQPPLRVTPLREPGIDELVVVVAR